MTEAQRRWKEEHKQHILNYQRARYKRKKKEGAKEEPLGLRECSCGLIAYTEADLVLFVKDPRSKHGRRNQCLACAAAAKRPDGEPVTIKVPTKCCKECGKVVEGEIEINKAFRRARPRGSAVVGQLVAVCKECEFPSDLYIEIDGKYIKRDVLPKTMHAKQLEPQ